MSKVAICDGCGQKGKLVFILDAWKKKYRLCKRCELEWRRG